jgi:hypothetical protein
MAWLNAVLLYGLLNVFGMVVAIVVPALLELLEKSPRLAMLGFLILVISPAIAVAIAHHGGHGTLDRFDKSGTLKEKKARGVFPTIVSWWAGVVGWLILIGTSTVTTFVMLVIFPPEPDRSLTHLFEAALPYMSGGGVATLQSILWVIIAAQFFNLERRARQADL